MEHHTRERHIIDREPDAILRMERFLPKKSWFDRLADDDYTDAGPDQSREPRAIVEILVSSRHLILASGLFKQMLEDAGFMKDGGRAREESPFTLNIECEYPEALTVLLNVLHCQNRQVSRQIGLDLLTNITIVAEKYWMLEAVEFAVPQWVEGLKQSMPTDYTGRNEVKTLQWIYLSWTFGLR